MVMMGKTDTSAQITLAATPIGNLSDATDRLKTLLHTADIIAAEDTRTAHQLARNLNVEITGKVVSHHEHNEAASAPELVTQAQAGAHILMISDAGMPLVSDPGFRLVQTAAAQGVTVSCAPGASAVTTALAVSGLSTDRFSFEGFVPRKPGERRRTLTEVATLPHTMVFYESPHRLVATLEAMAETLGEHRQACVARELTKLHEEIVRDTLPELAQWARHRQETGGIKGEIVIVVEGHRPQADTDTTGQIAQVQALVQAGTRMKDAVKQVAAERGVKVRDLYNSVLDAKNAEETDTEHADSKETTEQEEH